MDASVREFAVRTRGYDLDHLVWLDESTGAYRFAVGTDRRPEGFVSVFDGVQAATRTPREEGPSLTRYEGSPPAVARLAGSLSVTAAFAFVRGQPPPPNVTVTESTSSSSAANEEVFALPTGRDRRAVREAHPITSEVVGRGYWLGEEWGGAPPDFAAVSVAAGFVAVLVVYPRICVTTSTRTNESEELVGKPVTLGDGVIAVAADARTHPDGQFGTSWRHEDGSIHPIGHYGNDLTIAGVGQRAVSATVGNDYIIITGSQVDDRSTPTILHALRRI